MEFLKKQFQVIGFEKSKYAIKNCHPLLKKKIIAQFHYIPIYKFKVFNQNLKKKMAGAENYYTNSISLPIFFGLSKKKVNYILGSIELFFKKYSKNL